MVSIAVSKRQQKQVNHARTTLLLDVAQVKRARAHGVNISDVCRAAIETAVRAMETGKTQTLELKP